MAKKKKNSRKNKAESAERSTFWPFAGGILLCVLALFLLLGGFGTGGNLPVGVFKGGYWALGWAAYLLPLAFAYWGVYKFIGEDNRIPRGKLFSMLGVLVFLAACYQVLLKPLKIFLLKVPFLTRFPFAKLRSGMHFGQMQLPGLKKV